MRRIVGDLLLIAAVALSELARQLTWLAAWLIDQEDFYRSEDERINR